ncbi:MAG: LEA type 2 family protein [Thiohalocapsa sp.]
MRCRQIPGVARAVWPGLAVLLTLTACAGLTNPWTPPEVAVTSLRPQQIGADSQSLLLGLRIRNPNDRTLPINAMSYRLSVEGDEIAAGSGELERQIPAFGEEFAEVSVTGSVAQVASKLPALMLKSRPLQYQIAGTVTVARVLPIPYRYSGELDPNSLLRGIQSRPR